MFWVLFVFVNIYTIIPTIAIRMFGLGAYKGQDGQGIALTFDDGPDPEFTPQLLDLLDQYHIKATFFVLGSKAEQHPDLIRRIHNEGHLVGIHNYSHQTNALMSPWKVRLQLQHAVRTIENITGTTPLHYRPPWGVFNVFDLLLFNRFRVVLWSLIVGDWVSTGSAEKIKDRLLYKYKDGDIIVLHDSGDTLGADEDAPSYMLQALQVFLDQTNKQGYEFLRIDEKLVKADEIKTG
jgi:peptidoglycan/xylan/chitin deacetylase (PgdA/CDA1 family)